MTKAVYFLAAVAVAGASLAPAADPFTIFDGARWHFPKLHDERRDRAGWCLNDYAPKPMPAVAPNAKGCVDDYSRKPMPFVPPNAKGCVDDYCRKACPLSVGPTAEPWYSCPPPGPACVPGR